MSATRISLVLSGGASLGAYQAGAVAALLTAVAALRESGVDVGIDSLGGASAGALVAFLAAHGLLAGRDPVALLHGAWVERVDVDLLLGQDRRAPLGFGRLRTQVAEVLVPTEGERRLPPQQEPLVLHVALTGLRGLRYPVTALRGDREVMATTYVDWSRFRFEPGDGSDVLLGPRGSSPLDAVLASASNPGAFAPYRLDRRGDRDAYATHGITDLPEHGQLWYSDGGLLQSEPIGRVIEAARQLPDGADAARLVLLVDPRSEGPSGGRRFAEPESWPDWLDGLSRALSILPAQILYDDLRRVERDNRRLALLDELVEVVAPNLDDDAAAEIRRLVTDHLQEERGSDAKHLPSLDGADATTTLRAAVAEIAGLTGKEEVAVDVLSPVLLAEDHDDAGVPALLAGELLGDFGGFLSRDLRHSDFALGYATTRRWLDDGLPWLRVDDDTIRRVLETVDERAPAPWQQANRGRARIADTSWSSRASVARLALRVVGVGWRRVAPSSVAGTPARVRRLLRRMGERRRTS